jgi:putative FmdB family regulatory protein
MPTYDYVCDACGHAFEEFQSMSDALLKKCPKCKKSKLRRLFGTGAAVIFKGSGFYQTDYRSESYKNSAKADTAPSEPAKTETKSESKSEPKSEPKTESKPAESKPAESKPKKSGK